jgi:hypothetical protein
MIRPSSYRIAVASCCALALLSAVTAPRLLAQQPMGDSVPLMVNGSAPLAVNGSALLTVNQRPAAVLVAGGLAGGAAGAVVGGLLAGGLRSLGPCDDQDGCLAVYAEWAVSGAFLGQSLGLPLGVHLANHRQGNLAPAILASAAIGTGGLLTYWGIQRYGTDEWGNTRGNPDALTAVTIVAMPLLELAASIAIERASSRRRASR